MPPTLTNITDIGNIQEMADFLNTNTAGNFFGILLIAIFIIMVMRLLHHGVGQAMASASFICLIGSALLFAGGLLNVYYPIIFTLALASSALVLKFNG